MSTWSQAYLETSSLPTTLSCVLDWTLRRAELWICCDGPHRRKCSRQLPKP